MIRLLIVDDEPLVQVGMKSILDWSSYGIEICAAVSNGSEALLAIEKYRPHNSWHMARTLRYRFFGGSPASWMAVPGRMHP